MEMYGKPVCFGATLAQYEAITSEPINAFTDDVYIKLVDQFQNYVYQYSQPQEGSADKTSYESSSSGEVCSVCYEQADSKRHTCACSASSDRFTIDQNYRYNFHYNEQSVMQLNGKPCQKTVTSFTRGSSSVRSTGAKSTYYIPSAAMPSTSLACYVPPNVVTTTAEMHTDCLQTQHTYNEYVYKLLQYQNLNDQITLEGLNSQYSYLKRRHGPHLSNSADTPRHYRQVERTQETHSNRRKSKDAIKNLLEYPIREQIAKFEHLLLQFRPNDRKTKENNKPSSHCKAISNPQQSKQASNFRDDQVESYRRQTKTPDQKRANNNNHERKKTKTFLGLYEVLSLIGVGGGGVVYAGIQISDQRPVAIKRIMREKIKRWGLVSGRRVPQEIALMIKVNGHGNVINLINWYECLDSFVMIMERPNNSIDLFDYIRAVGQIPEKEGAYIFRQVAAAVQHVQEKGVLHRDVKDENVIIDYQTKSAKLIDFGCGTVLHSKPYTDFSGTPEFYPPEWYSKKQYYGTPASVWSLGVLLYDMLCGEIPFKTKSKITANKLVYKVNLSSESKHLISWMLQTAEDKRPTLIEVLNHPWIRKRT